MEVREPSAKYLARSGYKQTEVGVIPEDWGVSTVGAEFFIQLGKMLDAEKNVGVPKPFLGNRAIQWGHVDLTDIGEIKLTPADLQRFRLRSGDLLVCEGGEVGRAAIWQEPAGECYYQKALHRLRPIRGYNVELMLNLLQWFATTGFLQNFVTQTSIAHLPKDKFEIVPIPLPPTKAEQEAIAEALSDADAFIESLEQLLAKKRQLKQGAMQQLLTGKKRLPGFSGEWEVKRLGDVADTDPENLGADTRPTFAFNYIALEDVDVGALRSYSEQVFRTAPSRARRKLRKADVLVSTVRPNLMSHLLFPFEGEQWVCSTGFCVVRCREGVTHPGYVYFHMFAASVARQIEALLTGSNYPAINSGDVRALQIPFPGYDEQTAIAAILSDMDAEIATLEAKLAKARNLKQGMMQELLTGRIRLVCIH